MWVGDLLGVLLFGLGGYRYQDSSEFLRPVERFPGVPFLGCWATFPGPEDSTLFGCLCRKRDSNPPNPPFSAVSVRLRMGAFIFGRTASRWRSASG